jgi:hypothetical protein
MTHVIFGVERLKIVVFGEVQAPSHTENAFLDGDIDVRFLDTGHLKNDLQSILRFENVGCRQVGPSWDRRLFFRFEFAFLLHLQFLFGSHSRCSSF